MKFFFLSYVVNYSIWRLQLKIFEKPRNFEIVFFIPNWNILKLNRWATCSVIIFVDSREGTFGKSPFRGYSTGFPDRATVGSRARGGRNAGNTIERHIRFQLSAWLRKVTEMLSVKLLQFITTGGWYLVEVLWIFVKLQVENTGIPNPRLGRGGEGGVGVSRLPVFFSLCVSQRQDSRGKVERRGNNTCPSHSSEREDCQRFSENTHLYLRLHTARTSRHPPFTTAGLTRRQSPLRFAAPARPHCKSALDHRHSFRLQSNPG